MKSTDSMSYSQVKSKHLIKSMVKTTPENVAESNDGLFHATMNLPTAAAHCGMTEREMKHIFREYLKYHDPNFEITEDTPQISRG